MICEPLESINYEAIILNEPVKNSVLQYNYFYKLLYSTNIVVLSSIFTIFELTNSVIENDSISFNKNNANCDVFNKLIALELYFLNFVYSSKNNANFDVFNKLIALEEYLLKLLNSSKTKLFRFKEIYDNKSLRFVFNETNDILCDNINTVTTKHKYLILKISGLWESKESIGLTFKFIVVNKYLQFY
jgi:hypothetical protein